MARRSANLFVQDMLDHIEIVEGLISGRDVASYANEPLVRLALERCIEIVSEASRQIPEELKQRHPQIPWRNIRDVGNILRHGYSFVDNTIIWGIATKSLPELKPVLQVILTQMPPEP